MTTSLKGSAMAGSKDSRTSQLRTSLAQTAKSLSDRPKELRGPFAVRPHGPSTANLTKAK